MEDIFRELPSILIHGVEFTIDLYHDELRDVTNPFNIILFIELKEKRSGYSFCFDPQTRNVFQGDRDEYDERLDLRIIDLPSMQELDPVGFMELKNDYNQDMDMGRGRKR